MRKDSFSPAPLTAQTVKVNLRAGTGGLEAKLAEAPLCDRSSIERFDSTVITHQKLDTQDEVAKWVGWGGTAIAGGLVTVGVARGRDAGRGTLLFGLYGIPFAAVAGWETWRSRDLESKGEPISVPQPPKRVDCPPGKDRIVVDFVAGSQRTPVTLTPKWKVVKLSVGDLNRFKSGLLLPASLSNRRWVTYIPMGK